VKPFISAFYLLSNGLWINQSCIINRNWQLHIHSADISTKTNASMFETHTTKHHTWQSGCVQLCWGLSSPTLISRSSVWSTSTPRSSRHSVS